MDDFGNNIESMQKQIKELEEIVKLREYEIEILKKEWHFCCREIDYLRKRWPFKL